MKNSEEEIIYDKLSRSVIFMCIIKLYLVEIEGLFHQQSLSIMSSNIFICFGSMFGSRWKLNGLGSWRSYCEHHLSWTAEKWLQVMSYNYWTIIGLCYVQYMVFLVPIFTDYHYSEGYVHTPQRVTVIGLFVGVK